MFMFALICVLFGVFCFFCFFFPMSNAVCLPLQAPIRVPIIGTLTDLKSHKDAYLTLSLMLFVLQGKLRV